jgi:chaperonin GroEL (HSP60 family)
MHTCLAENAGLNTIDILVALRSAHQKKRGVTMGVDVFSGDVTNMLEKGVIEPVWVKQHALKSATEVACMILRIDDVIAATKPNAEGMPSRGMEE